jgi:uncharacterized protein (TIGR02001 family)
MRNLLSSVAVAAALAAGPALADGLTASGSVNLTSRYFSYGLPQSTGAAIQPSVEFGYNGFYAGIWASNTSSKLIGNSTEVDLSFGYRHDYGPVSMDLGYVRYTYYGPQNNCCGEAVLNLSTTPVKGTDLGYRLSIDPKSKVANNSVSITQAVMPKMSLNASVGKVAHAQTYWQFGGSYSVTDDTSVGLNWYDTTVTKGLAVLSLTYNFNLL